MSSYDQVIEYIFNQTQSLWHDKFEHPTWCGLTQRAFD